MKTAKYLLAAFALGILGTSQVASADVITWTDWTEITGSGASGQMGGVAVTVTASSGSMNGPSQTVCGANWWTEGTPPAYTSGNVENAPPPCEQVALSSPVTITVSFSSPVDNLYMALLSVGQLGLTVTYDFDTPFTVDSEGRGYWGDGFYSLGSGDTLLANEFHGVLYFAGPISSLSFTTSPTEYWHAFTFGMGRSASVPEPGPLALLSLSLALLGLAGRRKRT